jgi:GR25 family glycosyltransferase involved in LPS biosynthesis
VISFGIGVVAHHTRHERATRLAEAIDAEVVSVDYGGLGAGRNHEKCYQWLAESAEPWSVVLEDDAMPVKGFRTQLDGVLKAAPTGLVSLYLGRARPPHWQSSIAQVITGDEHFLTGTELLHHVAVAIQTPMIPSMLNFIRSDADYRDAKLPIDEAIGRWARAMSIKVSYAHPSIVNHDHTLDTVIKRHVSQHRAETGKRGRYEQRKAWAFGSRQQWEPTIAAIPQPAM